jgi:hypothetical protein
MTKDGNRRLKVTKLENVTIREHLIGTSYKKTSIFKHKSTEIDMSNTHEAKENRRIIFQDNNKYWSIERRLNEQETIFLRQIKNWGIIDTVPECEDRISVTTAINLLRNNYEKIAGARQVGDSLFHINCCRQLYDKGNFKDALSQALELASTSKMAVYASNESLINLGSTKTQAMISENTKFSPDQYIEFYEYFESLRNKDSKIRKGKAWELVVNYIKDKYNTKISEQTLRKNYKNYCS